MKHLIKTPSSALLTRLYKESLRACGARRFSGDPESRMGFLRKVYVEYNRRLEAAGVYVEHADLPEVNTEAWRQRDRADELRDCSFLTLARKIA